jgi:hypothetical protein
MAQTKTRASSGRPARSRKTQRSDSLGSAATAVGHAAKRARTPLIASAAALAGAAGGAALGARQARRQRGRALARTAKGVGIVGTQVGRLASEIHQAREAANAENGKARSPVEVVLEGLTARRSPT